VEFRLIARQAHHCVDFAEVELGKYAGKLRRPLGAVLLNQRAGRGIEATVL